MRARVSLLAIGLAAVVAGAVPVVNASTGQGHGTRQRTHASRSVPVDSFVSLVPACACSRRTGLAAFSLQNGRLLKTFLSVDTYDQPQLSTPAADDHHHLYFTKTVDARCAVTNTMECPRYLPNSCVNTVVRFSPRDTTLLTAFAIPGSLTLGAAVPDPGGSKMALTLSPCTTLNGTSGVFVRNLTTGQTRPVFTTRNTCDQFTHPTWDASGRRIAFVFDRARGLPQPSLGPDCISGNVQRVAVVRNDGGSQHSGTLLLAPDRGCVFAAPAFDRLGIVAMEGCQQGHPGWQPPDGYVYLKQFSSAGTFIRRVRIGIGLDDAEMARIPYTGSVLATLNQGANEPWPERDWVSEFNGTQLRRIARYKAWDANQIDAVPW
jgi:hypothetical protein